MGYYVYPLLQGDTFIGRIELQADRKVKQLHVVNFWKEKEVIWNDNRQALLNKELSNFARFVELKYVKNTLEAK